MTRRSAFTESDITRVLRGARKAGHEVRAIEIDATGRIVAQLGQSGQDDTVKSEDEWSRRIHAWREARPARERH